MPIIGMCYFDQEFDYDKRMHLVFMEIEITKLRE